MCGRCVTVSGRTIGAARPLMVGPSRSATDPNRRHCCGKAVWGCYHSHTPALARRGVCTGTKGVTGLQREREFTPG
eukprot:3989346-Pyramimonas_sp.AAC.1